MLLLHTYIEDAALVLTEVRKLKQMPILFSHAENSGTQSYQFVWLCVGVIVQSTDAGFDMSLNFLCSGKLCTNSTFFLPNGEFWPPATWGMFHTDN